MVVGRAPQQDEFPAVIQHTGILAGFAQQGYICVSVEYRLSGVAIFPAQIEDCKCAVRFLRANAKKYGLNPNRIGAWGESAGGHLAALLGTAGDVKDLEGNGGYLEFSSRVQAVCNWFGAIAFEGAYLPPEHSVSQLLGGPPQNRRELAKKASPFGYISQDDPPFLIMHGDSDKIVPVVTSLTFYKNLKAAGVDAALQVIQGAGHKFTEIHHFQSVLEFFDKHL